MSLLHAFNRHCQAAPDHIAFIEGDRRLSYSQVKQLAVRLSTCLTEREPPCQRVVIAMDRGIDAAIAILAALGAGACYIPLDIKNPDKRLQYIRSDAAPHCIIGRGRCPDWLDTPELWLDLDQVACADQSPNWPTDVHIDSPAAILYTSGSTGSPKGVVLSHRAMGNFAEWAVSVFKIRDCDRIASLNPFHFDLSVFDLFSSLSAGAAVHFVPSGLTLSPSRLTVWLREQHINVFYTVPSLLGFIALKGALATTLLPELKTILFAGEVFATPQLKILCDLLPDTAFYNLYGPTETNVCCYWPVDRERLAAGQPIPIGYPACNADLRIDSETGELLVNSANNLSGYWQQGELINSLSADHYYSTGDKVSINSQGEFCYHGRLDRMLKCSGYRVEPAEIEATLLSCPDVIGCAVVGITDSTSGQRPAAAVVLKPDATLDAAVKAAKQKLPAYMHPSQIIIMDSLPYLSNGKIDYQSVQRLLEKR